jgi:hypothetical protein
MQNKITITYHLHPTEWLKLKILTIPNIGKEVENKNIHRNTSVQLP